MANRADGVLCGRRLLCCETFYEHLKVLSLYAMPTTSHVIGGTLL